MGILPAWQVGQPCQKHPSTKSANLGSVKMKSGLPGSCERCPSRQPEIPALTKAPRRRHSVDLFPAPRIFDMIPDRTALLILSTTDPDRQACRIPPATLAATALPRMTGTALPNWRMHSVQGPENR